MDDGDAWSLIEQGFTQWRATMAEQHEEMVGRWEGEGGKCSWRTHPPSLLYTQLRNMNMSNETRRDVAAEKMMADGNWSTVRDGNKASASDEDVEETKEKGVSGRGWWRTWMSEQIPIALNLLVMAWWMGGFSSASSWRTLIDVWVSASLNFLGWKAMSIASRQQEINVALGITDHRIECWRAAERTGVLIQLLGLFRGIAFAPTPPHILHALFLATYKPYRQWYARHRSAAPR